MLESHAKLMIDDRQTGVKQLRFALSILLFCMASLYSQTNTAEIVGRVLDSTGAVLPGTTVVATHGASGFTVERITDDQGGFLLPALPLGEYTITVELPGFKRLVRQGIVLRVGQRASLDLVLELGDISENITVNATLPLLQKTTPRSTILSRMSESWSFL